MKLHAFFLLTASVMLASCGQQNANDGPQPRANASSAERGEAPAATDAIGALVYPGSQRSGDRFSSSDPIDRVLAWYWDEDRPMRERNGQTWAVSKPERRDGGYLVGLTIVSGEEGQSSAIYLNPRAGGGTEGRIRLITDEELRSGVKL